jgi:hypothetical protein
MSEAKPDRPLSEPVLYILMRTDLPSMNPGKAIAQGGHAVSHFMESMRQLGATDNVYQAAVVGNLLKEWMGDRGFGTKITLGVTLRQLRFRMDLAAKLPFEICIGGEIVDPTYPLRDGDVIHLFPLLTCAYVFGRKAYLAPLLDGLSLHA